MNVQRMPSARNTFIFRAKRREGDEGDLRIFIVEGLTDIWLASKSHRIMAPGDIVFFWMAGKPEIRGIYGWGILISVAEKDFEDGSLSVSVRYERRVASLRQAHAGNNPETPPALAFLASHSEPSWYKLSCAARAGPESRGAGGSPVGATRLTPCWKEGNFHSMWDCLSLVKTGDTPEN